MTTLNMTNGYQLYNRTTTSVSIRPSRPFESMFGNNESHKKESKTLPYISLDSSKPNLDLLAYIKDVHRKIITLHIYGMPQPWNNLTNMYGW